MLRCPREQAKWPTSVPIQLPLKFCIFAKRLFYEKEPNFKSSNCSAEVIRRCSWQIRYCLEKSNQTHTHTHTHTTHACAPRVTNTELLSISKWSWCAQSKFDVSNDVYVHMYMHTDIAELQLLYYQVTTFTSALCCSHFSISRQSSTVSVDSCHGFLITWYGHGLGRASNLVIFQYTLQSQCDSLPCLCCRAVCW